ncbi:uncharacterized protein LOC109710182 [Ananas comosus]|uniref:Uncharacterized protein LOC109710182 n=1 Tax=Ananas comosus TaxID=4615 RepID=A0A6P5F4Q7_ANACO|nr:uncharacterized protein LOC109710182 [Ananas comosus]
MGPPVELSFVEGEGDATGAEGSSSAQLARGHEAGVGVRRLGFLRRRSIWRKVVSFVPTKIRSIVLLNVLSVIFDRRMDYADRPAGARSDVGIRRYLGNQLAFQVLCGHRL